MLPKKLLYSTSTPFDKRYEFEESSADSGYQSSLSGHNLSIDSSLPTCQSKSSSVIETPDTTNSLFSNLSSAQACEQKKNQGDRFRMGYVQNTLIGKEYVDFLYYLGEKSNYGVILKKILDYLDDEDLYNAVAVSKLWKNVILSNSVQRKRFRSYARKIELIKENRITQGEYDVCNNRSNLTSRSTLTEIQNISSNVFRSSMSPPVMYRNYRFEAYQTEAQRLKLGKRLFSCPKCKLPSHIDEKEPHTAVCTNLSCQYRFCMLCQCVEHPSRICHFISTPVVRKQSSLVGTQTSKKNLKRLLL